jgi:prephenate dehydrogenase
MAEISVAILGLKRSGASVGLALERYNQNSKKSGHTFLVSGYDTSSDIAKAAQEMGAIKDTQRELEAVTRDKDIVIVALPFGEVEAAYELMSSSLRSGVVVVDMSMLAQSSLKIAEKHLPEDAHVVCVAPMVNPKYLFEGVDDASRASADFFDGGSMMVMPSVSCVKEAVTLAADLSKILGSTPNFYDPAEYEPLIGGTEGLPSLLGVALFYNLSKNDGWADYQRLTNPAFGMMTRHLFDTHPDDLREFWMNSGASFVRHIDELMLSLREFRTLIADGDNDALSGALDTISKEYESWYNRRMHNDWDKGKIEQPSLSGASLMGNMFGRFSFRRGGDDEDDE